MKPRGARCDFRVLIVEKQEEQPSARLAMDAEDTLAHWWPLKILTSTLGIVGLGVFAYLLVARLSRPRLLFQRFDPVQLANAKLEGRPAVVDFSATWCLPCREMERSTFASPKVLAEGERFVKMRVDVSSDTPESNAAIDYFHVEEVPTILFIDSKGAIRQ